jgi:hypothetical protein
MRTLFFILMGCLAGTAVSQTLPKAQELKMDFDSKTEMTETWKSLASEAAKVRVFLGGENHKEIDFNSLMEYGFMNRLHKYAGYRHYVIELSPARAHYLNRYIGHSDTHARDVLKGISSPKYMNLFENLHRWNQSLDSAERIQIHGIDVERFYDLSVERLAENLRLGLQQKPCPDSLLATVMATVVYANRKFDDRLKDFNAALKKADGINGVEEFEEEDSKVATGYDFWRYDYSEMRLKIESQIPIIKEWLGPVLSESFLLALQGIKECDQWEKEEQSASRFHWRESVMYSRFKEALETHKGGRFFGQFGRCHISESRSDIDCGWYGYESVLNQLINSYFGSPDSVISIGYFYKDRVNNVSAAEVGNQAQLEREITALNRPYMEGLALYDLAAADADLRELRKKYRYVLVNNATNSSLESQMPNSDYQAQPKSSWHLEGNMPYLGISFWQIQSDPMREHFKSQGRDFNLGTQWGLQHQVGLTYGPLAFGLSGYYTQINDANFETAVYKDSLGGVFYGHWGIDVLAGLHWHRGVWSLDLMGRIGTARSKYTYKQTPLNTLDVTDVNGLRIHNQSWNAGFSGQLYYRFSSIMGAGINAATYTNVGHGYWIYSGSNQPYANLGLASGLQAWSLTAQLCLFFSN